MNPEILERRQAAILEMRFLTLARAGKPIAAAYVNKPPQPRISWGGGKQAAAPYVGKPLN